MQVGFGRTDITPELGTPCALGIDSECIKVFDPIHATVLHLRAGDEAVVLVSADIIGFYGPEMRMVQREVGDRLEVPAERVMVHGTHTHQSPGVRSCVADVLDEFDIPSYSREYAATIRQRILQAADEAANLTPVTARAGAAMVERIASNRRCIDDRGRFRFRASRPAAEMRAYPEGDIDPFVRVVAFDAADGGSWALVSYACHPTSTGGDEAPYVTADFPGEAIRRLETQRDGLRCIYGTGPCGNINPGKWVGDGDDPQSRCRDRDAMGERLAEAAGAALDAAEPVEADALRFAAESIRLPLRDELPREDAAHEQLERAAENYRAQKAAGHTSWGGFGLTRLAAYEAIRRQAPDGYLDTFVAAVGLGDIALVFLPGESFLEAGRAAVLAGDGRFVVPIENTDYSASYIPTPESYALGGYEVETTRWSPEAFRAEVAAAARVTRRVLG
jgi:hypothetical protein